MTLRVTIMGLVLFAALTWSAPAIAGPPAWAYGPDMNVSRVSFVSVPLSDGRIVAIGGTYNPPAATASAEVLSAAPGGWTSTAGAMSAGRRYFAGVPLASDHVLVAGGAGDGSGAALASAEVWDPLTGAFTGAGSMGVARQSFSLTTLPDGRALAAGGSPDVASGAGSAAAELYDPLTNAWSGTGSMTAGRLGHTGTMLPDCRVLIVGDNPTAELYNYKTATFSRSGSAPLQRSYHTATLLTDGRVLIAGGVDVGNTPLATAEVYDPATGQFSPAGSMSESRTQAMAVRLADGRVLVAGGLSGASKTATKTADVYNPATNAWTPVPDMLEKADSAQAQLLADGRAVVYGGDYSGGKKTQIFDPGDSAGPPKTPPAPDCTSLPGPSSGSGGPGDGGSTPGTTGSTGGPGSSPVVRQAPAETVLLKHPKKIVKARAKKLRVTFTFRSPTQGATFSCKLDKARAKACRSPARYWVQAGKHTFVVTAKGPAGSDPTPARFRFTVKRKR
jgi:hypothetical protein